MEEHCYIISYDLSAPCRNYEDLYNAIKSYTYWGKLTESTWAVVTSQSYIQIRDDLKKYIDENDKLIVIQSGRAAAWTKILASDSWAKTNLVK